VVVEVGGEHGCLMDRVHSLAGKGANAKGGVGFGGRGRGGTWQVPLLDGEPILR
jgi:hypothetical protein